MTLGHVCCLCMYFGCLRWPHSRFCFLPFLGAGPSCCGWYIISWLPYPLALSCWYDAYLFLWCILLWPLVLKVCFSLRKCGCFFLLVIGALPPFCLPGFLLGSCFAFVSRFPFMGGTVLLYFSREYLMLFLWCLRGMFSCFLPGVNLCGDSMWGCVTPILAVVVFYAFFYWNLSLLWRLAWCEGHSLWSFWLYSSLIRR